MTSRILFVCAQNVCRSAYLAAVVGSDLDRTGAGYDVVSRGAHADPGLAMCSVAMARLPELAAARGEAHRSRILKRGDVDRAGLILTATGAERSAVALLDPAARRRSFTVREFIHLAAVDGGAGLEGGRGLTELVALSNGRRGAPIPPAAATRGIFGRRRTAVSPLDIPDLHRERRAAHRALFAELDADAAALLRLLAPPAG